MTYTGNPPAAVRAAVDYVLSLFDSWLVLSTAAPVRVNFTWTNLTSVSAGLLYAQPPLASGVLPSSPRCRGSAAASWTEERVDRTYGTHVTRCDSSLSDRSGLRGTDGAVVGP